MFTSIQTEWNARVAALRTHTLHKNVCKALIFDWKHCKGYKSQNIFSQLCDKNGVSMDIKSFVFKAFLWAAHVEYSNEHFICFKLGDF